MKILQLGAGKIGQVIAKSLSQDYSITVADLDPPSSLLQYGIQTNRIDLKNCNNLSSLINSYDFIVGALPAHLSYQVLTTVINCHKNFVDVSYLPENVQPLDDLAKSNNVTGIYDCGLAPGLTNLIVGEALQRKKVINTAKLYVGGVAQDRKAPYGYCVTWSVSDLLEEYVRPARYISNNILETRPALSSIEEVIFPEVGEMEGFLTDGLRSLLKLKNINTIIEKTLRWPGHVKAVKPLIKNGSFVEKIISNCNSNQDLVVLHCKIDDLEWNMIELPQDGMTAMQRTTALTCAEFARLVIEKQSELKYGVYAPEELALYYTDIVNNLEKQNICLREK